MGSILGGSMGSPTGADSQAVELRLLLPEFPISNEAQVPKETRSKSSCLVSPILAVPELADVIVTAGGF